MSYVSPIKIGYEAEPEEGWTDKIGKYIAGEVDNLVLQSCVKVGCHVDKDELEKALRYDRDQYVKGYEDGKRDAADAIEELQDKVVELEEELNDADVAADDNARQIEELEAEVKRLELDNEDYEHSNRWLHGEIEALQAEVKILKVSGREAYFDGLAACADPKRGKWKPLDLTYGRSIYSCSVCEQATEVPMCMEKPMYVYCPNCGAKMEVQE